jgi:hypothetical protein
MRDDTNDSTYIESAMKYQEDGVWKEIPTRMRARGNYRRKNCYFPPVHVRVKKDDAKETLFEGNKKLKLVLPCLIQRDNSDNVIKELMAYKLYEVVSPYHFKTRMLHVEFVETRGKKEKLHNVKGFFIEDDKRVAVRNDGKLLKRKVHPLQQDDLGSVQNDFFQYMIGNTDFSTAYQHNEKLIFVDKKAMPLPYDFDMSGLVDASYAVVSEVQNEKLSITSVKQRLYRGFKRDAAVYNQVRQEFLANKQELLQVVDSLESSFDNPKEFSIAKNYITSFFTIMEDDSKFNNQILKKARTK